MSIDDQTCKHTTTGLWKDWTAEAGAVLCKRCFAFIGEVPNTKQYNNSSQGNWDQNKPKVEKPFRRTDIIGDAQLQKLIDKFTETQHKMLPFVESVGNQEMLSEKQKNALITTWGYTFKGEPINEDTLKWPKPMPNTTPTPYNIDEVPF